MRLVVFLLIRLLILLMLIIFVNSSTKRTSNFNHENFTKGHFTGNITDYQIVIPKKISSDGSLVSNYLPHFHNADDVPKNITKREIFFTHDPIHYNVPINGKTVKVRLMPNESPFPKSMVIEHHTSESAHNIGKARLRRPEKQNCHFKGKVVDDPDSLVALSTCNGLAGFIQSKDGDYFIEPIKDSRPGVGDHPHIVYKKRDEGSKFKDKNCFVKGKDKKIKNCKADKKEMKDLSLLKSGKKLLTQPVHGKKKKIKHSRKQKNKEDEGLSKFIDDDDIENSVSLLPLHEMKPNIGDKQSKIKKFIKGRDNLESLDDIVEYKKNKFGDVNTNLKKKIELAGHKALDLKESDIRRKDCTRLRKKSSCSKKKIDKHKNKRKLVKASEVNPSFSANKNSSEVNVSDKYKHLSNSIKDKKNSDKVAEKSGNEESIDTELHKKDSKKLLPSINNNDNELSDWDNVVKAMKMKDEQYKNEIDVKENIFKDINNVSNENSQHPPKIGTLQSARSLMKHERNKGVKKNKESLKHSYHEDLLNHESSLFHRKKSDDNLIDENGSRHSYNTYNMTECTDNHLYLDRHLRSSDIYVEDLKNIPKKMKEKRSVQYKSCRPQPVCKNKTEVTFDLRLLMVISYEFSQHHKDTDLETYILTIVNMISTNFHDASLGFLLNVKLVRMVFIEYKLEELDEEKNSLEQLFENFCVFQYRINPHRMDHPNHHDIAVYVVSFESCAGDKTLGITNTGSVCHSKESCILSRDEGLLLGNIVTHQLGHSLGADHDDGGQGSCQPNEPDGSVYYHMNPMISLNSTQWSRCSSEAIQRFLRNQGARCLEYLSTELDFDWPDILPGQIYNPVQQCALNFRMKTLPCYTGDFCKYLYCQATKKECVSLLVPPADGTSCASGMWCVRGMCVRKGRRPGMVNGEWSIWGPWSRCSRTCGGGVQHSFRLCNNPPPALGGRYCVGKRLRHQICNAETSCDRFTASFREYQCKITDSVPFRGKFYTWRAFHNHFEYVECALLCESQSGIVAVRQLVTFDGTPCKPGTKNVCIQGKCMNVGCDWQIDSGAVRDACGICHGNGTECRVIQGIFDEKNGTGYVPFLKVPKGSGMIYAREINPASMKLVVASYNTDYFYLNGPAEGPDSRPAEYDFGNVKGVYSVRGRMERIFIPGPTEEDLVFYVKFVDSEPNPGVRYQFAFPETDRYYVPTYSWQFLDWDLCSDACGGGQQKATAKCVEDQAGIVDGKYCLEREKPPDIIRSCNEFPCLPRWWIGAWSDCVEVANEKVRYRSVLCMRTRDPNSLRNEILKDKYCCEEEKPDAVRRCNETVEEKQEVYCDIHNHKADLPTIYNLKDLQGHFADLSLKEFKSQFSNDRDIEDSEESNKYLVSLDGGLDSPVSQHVVGSLNVNGNDEKKEKNLQNIQGEKIFAKAVKKLPTNITDQPIKLNKENVKFEDNDELKKKHAKTRLQHQPGLKDDNNLILNVNDKDLFSPEKKMLLKNVTVRNQKIELLGLTGSTGLNFKLVQKEVQSSKDANDKFGGSTCSLNTIHHSKKYPPIHLPTESTCTKKCTTCALPLQFTIPNSDFFSIRPPCPEVDQVIVPEFTISIIPIACEPNSNPTDMYFEIFHESGSWPHALEANKTLIKGPRALFYLKEIRENVTTQPFVFHAEN